MTSIDNFLLDDQDPKTVEKVIHKLMDLITTGEEIQYLAVQKKPAVTLLPDSIAITNKRIFYCSPGNLGLTMNFKDISWKNIKEVSFKEEFFGSKFICVPTHGENIVTEYIPKVQARKLHQAVNEQLERYKEAQDALKNPIVQVNTQVEEPIPVVEVSIDSVIEEDETTIKLRKLKTLFDKGLITIDEYEAKKADILDSL
ncbi:PH domain-containing protein [Pedobacter flavus]|uniref:PH domain-containing protein n=1 Tax=Pedobacter flavus TaxID=3113906 RepID=A0ABU7H0T7_9SPHI|nr:PH domain-containing protein [Pedobacter sp. VNH31]MEE1884850.1 PH domain-containing protein [Pedobacter sp. VNH31]